MAKIEAGQPVTQQEVDRLAALQALDLARAGREFVAQACQRDDELTKVLDDAKP
jgi:hypothetical protein